MWVPKGTSPEGLNCRRGAMKKYILEASLLLFININSFSQGLGNSVSGRQIGNGVLTSGTSFIAIGPDTRGSALGEAGVATSADVNSLYWNNAKLVFIDGRFGGSVSYSPWLHKITNDMFLSYVSGYYRIDDQQVFGMSMRYFNLGDFEINDNFGNFVGSLNPYQVAFDITYSRKLTEELAVGISGRYIRSNTSRQFSLLEGTDIGSTVAIDLGVYYQKKTSLNGHDVNISFGTHLSNFGPKIKYNDFRASEPIPTNLRLGTAFRYHLDSDNSVTFVFDVNKLMVPSPPIIVIDPKSGERSLMKGKETDRNLFSSTFGSFTDAPEGFSEEMKELTYSLGLEYWYRELFALRGGYFHEHEQKGNRKYLTFGSGFRYQAFEFSASYLIPTINNHPMAETLRLSVFLNYK